MDRVTGKYMGIGDGDGEGKTHPHRAPLPCLRPLWRQHCRDDAKSWLDSYTSRIADYNKPANYDVMGDDKDLYIIKNLDPE